MRSIILRSATRYLFPIIVLFSVFLLLRGHDEPGGGFIGGLLAATAFALYGIAYGIPAARAMLRVDLIAMLGVGLLLATSAGLIGMFGGDPFLTTRWGTLFVPGLGEVKLGTPLLFDVGVYLVVIGVTLMLVFNLAEE